MKSNRDFVCVCLYIKNLLLTHMSPHMPVRKPWGLGMPALMANKELSFSCQRGKNVVHTPVRAIFLTICTKLEKTKAQILSKIYKR